MKFWRTALEAFKWFSALYVLCGIIMVCTSTIEWPESAIIMGIGPLMGLTTLFENPLRSMGLMTSPGWFSFPTAGGLILVAAGAYAVVFLAVRLFGGRKR